MKLKANENNEMKTANAKAFFEPLFIFSGNSEAAAQLQSLSHRHTHRLHFATTIRDIRGNGSKVDQFFRQNTVVKQFIKTTLTLKIHLKSVEFSSAARIKYNLPFFENLEK